MSERAGGLRQLRWIAHGILAGTPRNQALANENAVIEQQRQKLNKLEADRKRLKDEAEFYVKRDTPEELKRKFKDNDSRQAQAQRAIEAVRTELLRISGRFDADLERYRELINGTAKPPFRCDE